MIDKQIWKNMDPQLKMKLLDMLYTALREEKLKGADLDDVRDQRVNQKAKGLEQERIAKLKEHYLAEMLKAKMEPPKPKVRGGAIPLPPVNNGIERLYPSGD